MQLGGSQCTVLQAISNGRDAVCKTARDEDLSRVYGPVIDNFSCHSKVLTAGEVTAGYRLVTKHATFLV